MPTESTVMDYLARTNPSRARLSRECGPMTEMPSFVDEHSDCHAGSTRLNELPYPGYVFGDAVGAQNTTGSLPDCARNSARR